MFFTLVSYCGVCYPQVKLSISFVIVVQKSSSGDQKSLVIAPPIQCKLSISTICLCDEHLFDKLARTQVVINYLFLTATHCTEEGGFSTQVWYAGLCNVMSNSSLIT